MADPAGLEPDVTEQRKARDPEVGGSTANDENNKIEDEPSVHGSNPEKVQSRGKEEKIVEEKKPSKLHEMFGKLGLDMGTALMMFKYV
jgi:hypothetical protein